MRPPSIPCCIALLFAAGPAAASLVFHDGFEPLPPPGTTIECLQGPPQAAAIGPLPSGSRSLLTCFELRNDRDFSRDELAFGSVPVPRAVDLRSADLPRLLVAGPGEERLPAQFRILSRWGSTADDDDAPARWLQIALPATVAADAGTVFALLRYDAPPAAAADPLAITVGNANGRWQIDTGTAVFELDPANPALFHRITLHGSPGVAAQDVLVHQPGVAGYGPRLRVGNGAGALRFEADNSIASSLQVVDAQIREQGPAQVVVTMDGLFSSSGSTASRCGPGPLDYASFQWSLEARFARGSRHVDLYLLLRHACSGGFGPPWDDEAAEVLAFDWNWTFEAIPGVAGNHYYAGGGATVATVGNAAATRTAVEQRRGSGSPWRNARVQQAGDTLETAAAFARPLAALQNDRVLAAVQMPWMRFREPQALAAEGHRLSLQAISEPVIVGEGKGLWFLGRLRVDTPAAAPATVLQQWRDAGYAALERGLLPHAAAWANAGDHWPPLNPGPGSAMLPSYLTYMNNHHAQNVSEAPCIEVEANVFEGGSWDCAKTYGAQLWPDIQIDESFGPVVNATPADNSPFNNYWNPSGAELFEFLRSGDPRWVWDFALPQIWLMAQTAGLNVGDRADTIRNGFVVNSTGSGDGHWHRGDGGSDDYNYNRGHHLGFALRPNYPLLERFGAQGRTVIFRYDIPRAQQLDREQFVDRVNLDRGPMQHFEGLANCAEFVPGPAGLACRSKLTELLHELAHDNLAAGVVCGADVPTGTDCSMAAGSGAQQFMVNSMFYPFLLRMLLNYGDIVHDDDGASVLRRALIDMPRHYLQYGLNNAMTGSQIDVNGQWAEGLACTLAAGGRAVLDCQHEQIEGGNLFFPNRPHTVALLLMSEWLDPAPTLCGLARQALQDMFPGPDPGDPDGMGPWFGYANGGWWKGASQAMQSTVFGVGLETRCAAQ
jgi:hypothetical protein